MSPSRHDSATLVHTDLDSPIGRLGLVADTARHAIVEVRFANSPLQPQEGGRRVDDDPVLVQAASELTEYFAGVRVNFEVALSPAGTEFQLAAWQALHTIPYGVTVSYAHQARSLGDVNKSRAVGAANGKNPIPIIVPCHRVVGANGSLTGFGGGLEAKAWLLNHERRVAGDQGSLFES